MNKLLITLAFLFLTLPEVKAQNQDNQLLIEENLRQSEKQKKTGITMMIAGGAATAVGMMLAWNSAWDSAEFGAGGFLMLAGSASVIIGIPIIVSSANKARKAATLSLSANSARMIRPNGFSPQVYPALNLTIPLHSDNR
ncbi:hypothetical protein GCM10009119_32700 [Algoriphagus jejuensis]|uniref:Superfamily III holin-X n=1 Tax=Algoriphagus jejuensis TaxID=419934 RepID=A0ABP3YFV6_9BACT